MLGNFNHFHNKRRTQSPRTYQDTQQQNTVLTESPISQSTAVKTHVPNTEKCNSIVSDENDSTVESTVYSTVK